ncbi:hypothetical protein BU23DRAFT_570353 [Bimuria novae-zelandiae CBS 107.79]|uniref:Uncharacterized protein n=1 Tax=Bimuria novae-zelandiae CBS 107.79 TaxID=1447943 RepID=A0A6A5V1B5_9PLEO|nr:hypothetical protein BU23DRAFT_570353 [Bimuria novae-zelandiae CBS 107.79]
MYAAEAGYGATDGRIILKDLIKVDQAYAKDIEHGGWPTWANWICASTRDHTVTSDCAFTLTGSNTNSGRCASKGPAHFLLIADYSAPMADSQFFSEKGRAPHGPTSSMIAHAQ